MAFDVEFNIVSMWIIKNTPIHFSQCKPKRHPHSPTFSLLTHRSQGACYHEKPVICEDNEELLRYVAATNPGIRL